METVLPKMRRFGIWFKNTPKAKAECKCLGPMEVPRKLRAARALMSEIVDIDSENAHSDSNYRLSEIIEVALSRTPISSRSIAADVDFVWVDFRRMSL